MVRRERRDSLDPDEPQLRKALYGLPDTDGSRVEVDVLPSQGQQLTFPPAEGDETADLRRSHAGLLRELGVPDAASDSGGAIEGLSEVLSGSREGVTRSRADGCGLRLNLGVEAVWT